MSRICFSNLIESRQVIAKSLDFLLGLLFLVEFSKRHLWQNLSVLRNGRLPVVHQRFASSLEWQCYLGSQVYPKCWWIGGMGCSLIRNQASHRSTGARRTGVGAEVPLPAKRPWNYVTTCNNCSSTHSIHLNLLLAISKHSPAQLFSGQKLWTGVTCEGTKNCFRIKCCSFWGKIFHCSCLHYFQIFTYCIIF